MCIRDRDNTTLSGVVAVFVVILAVQLFAGTIGGRSNRRLTFTAFRLGYCEEMCIRDSVIGPVA